MGIPFRTEISLSKSDFYIDYSTPVLMVGSCFSDNIGRLLNNNKFKVLSNPFGVLYNPTSISVALNTIIENKADNDSLVEHNGLWHSFNFHGSFSSTSREEVLALTNTAIKTAHDFLTNTSVLFITFGTAWIYNYINTNKTVANCHKIPSKEFTRKKLSIEEIVSDWSKNINLLKTFNPELKIIFTVSPVRHLKDGAHENQLSKSTLLLAIDELCNSFEHVSYFPSYELVMDELRDYRFYADDMIHISEKAVEFIFDKFKDAYLSDETKVCLAEIGSLVQSAQHRLLTNNKPEIEKFALSMLKKISNAEQKYPYVNFELEKAHFQNLI